MDYLGTQTSADSLMPKKTIPASATIDSSGLITYKNSSGTALFTLQLPLYDGGVST